MDSTNFVDLLNCQQDSVHPQSFPWESSAQVPVFSTQCTETSSFCEESPRQRKERKKWSPTADFVLISAWLNTSKYAIVSNEQRAGRFWSRISAYYAESPKVERGDTPGPLQCKQRWQKLNDLVSKFCGSYAAAGRQKTSGQSESDILKQAHNMFFEDHNLKFNLHHAWEALRYDQKWCEHASSKIGGGAKKRKCEDGAETSSSKATINLDDEPTARPPGVKAAKAAAAKKPIASHVVDEKFAKLCAIKEQDLASKEKDLASKEKLSKMTLLDSLITKKEPLSEKEEALKKRKK